ncbi:putative bifunctional diguanylate cyclase/phosphodiesterase [Paralcaligenes ureilyticus]|uniref:Diguanylate cyclase/phosphodiesterase n=1 Tax=Paralcaligenes ureilyticus TaxID=627131 RepID=A0A4R3LQJ3_9BURK|nr:EAL domain-containing protein [Paralcaligenes ureilyticus]TCT02814.1 diguanylate cyclase/phosphodiesterase [Paralcaligenes ureilyticus]
MALTEASDPNHFKTVPVLDRLLYFFSLYAVPTAIAILSVLTITYLYNPYATQGETNLAVRSITPNAPIGQPVQALQALRKQPSEQSQRVDSVESPSWLLIDVPSAQRNNPIIEIPSTQTQSLACWNAATLTPMGTANRSAHAGLLDTIKTGFSINLSSLTLPASILCTATFFNSTTIRAQLWPATDLRKSADRFQRNNGVLEGGLLTLSMFILIVALVNREWTHVLLATWLVGNLRMGALAVGWDTHWLRYDIPFEWMPFIRQVTIAVYYLLSYTLFTRLFQTQLKQVNQPGMQCVVQWSGIVLLAAALFLPRELFKPVMQAAVALGGGATIFLTSHILYRVRSRTAFWQIIALGLVASTMFVGILHITFGKSSFANGFTGTLALLFSSVIVALTVAKRIQGERRDKVRAQTELLSNYAVVPIGMFTLNAAGIIERANPAFEKMLGFSLEPDSLNRWTDFFPPQDWNKLAEMTLAGQGAQIKMRGPGEVSAAPRHFSVKVTQTGGKVEGSLQDISEQTETIHRLQVLANIDPLTDSLNQRGIENAFANAQQEAKKGKPCALAYLELDHFKRVSGLFGHITGDEVLQQICLRVKTVLSEDKQLGRVGGSEFVILFPGESIQAATDISRKLLDSLQAAPFQVGEHKIQIKASVGIVDVTPEMDVKDAVSAANRACRDAKKNFQEIVVYSQNAKELREHNDELRLFNDLESGAAPKGLFLEMQPVMSLHRPFKTLDFEVLLRVHNSRGVLIPTENVISAAEESGTIPIIDKWVFSATLEWLDKHQSSLANTRSVYINLNGDSLNDEKFVDAFFTILARYEHLTKRICIEITEGVALNSLDNTRQFMKRLQRKGVRIALDDFGAGYTSFSYLKSLPADVIKIDGILIKDMMSTPANIAIIRSIVELTHSLGMKCIAEWVEDSTTLKALWAMNVDYVQGHVIARSMLPSRILNATGLIDLIADPEVISIAQNATAPI